MHIKEYLNRLPLCKWPMINQSLELLELLLFENPQKVSWAWSEF